MKTARSIAKGTAERLALGAKIAEVAAETAVSVTKSAAKDSMLSSKTALGAYSMFQLAKGSVEVVATAVITTVASRLP